MGRIVHRVKCLRPYFRAVVDRTKPFEVRFNDRDYRVGDVLCLVEIDEAGNETYCELATEITYVLDDPQYCLPGYVILGLGNRLTQ